MGRMKKAEREHFLAVAKEQFAEYDLTIDDLTKDELSDLIQELRDREAGHVVLDGFFPIFATQMKWRKELELGKAKERLAKYSLTIEDLTKQELSELIEEIRDEEKGRVVILDGIEPLLVEKSYKKLAKLHNGESANQAE